MDWETMEKLQGNDRIVVCAAGEVARQDESGTAPVGLEGRVVSRGNVCHDADGDVFVVFDDPDYNDQALDQTEFGGKDERLTDAAWLFVNYRHIDLQPMPPLDTIEDINKYLEA